MSMRVAIMQPYCFPYIGYFQLVNAVETFVFLDDVNYIKRGWINRNRILINGEPNWINIPCRKISQNRMIKDTQVLVDDTWKYKELKKIELAYRRAPFYHEVISLLQKCFFSGQVDIASFASFSVMEVVNYLGRGPKFMWSSREFGDTQHLKGSDRLIEIAKRVGAEFYINPIGGTELYSREKFEKAGIQLRFLKSNEDIRYPQFREDTFVPWLSIIDVLMFNQRDAVSSLLSRYDLVS